MTQDRDGLTIKGRHVLHSTACRDWLCGTCGSKLVTRWFEDAPNWRTVCTADDHHDPDEFVHGSTWAYLEARQQMDAMKGREVFAHLPDELQAAILE